MASTVNNVANNAAQDPSQKFASPSRARGFALAGGALALGATAAATYLVGGIPVVATQVGSLLSKFNVTLPALSAVLEGRLSALSGYGTITALGAATAATGAVSGAVVGRVTAHKAKLSQVKSQMGISDSDLNFGQIDRVAKVAVKGGIFRGRSLEIRMRPISLRIANLDDALLDTERSLSHHAQMTSGARMKEDRFFDLEGRILAESGDIISSLIALKEAINGQVKATEKYTFQQGNSQTSISRRDYMFGNIMKFAHQHGVAENFLVAAVEERKELAKTDIKFAEANFKKALQAGIAAGVLAPEVDPKAFLGMVKAAAVAAEPSHGKNPDSAISSVFNQFVDAGLISSKLRSRFVAEVRSFLGVEQAVASDVDAESALSDAQEGKKKAQKETGLLGRIFGRSKMKEESATVGEEEALGQPSVATSKEAKEAEKARLALEAQIEADGDVSVYSSTLQSLEPRQKQLMELYEKLARLLGEKSIPLNQIMAMGSDRLRGALVLRHKEGLDLFAQYEANDTEIKATRATIDQVIAALDQERVGRPTNFKLATKAQRSEAETLEKQVKTLDAETKKLQQKVAGLDANIARVEAKLGDDQGETNTFLFPVTEQALPKPVKAKKPGLLDQIRARFKKEAADETAVAEEKPLPSPVVSKKKPADETAVVEEKPLPSPVVSKKKPADRADVVAVAEDVLPEPVVG